MQPSMQEGDTECVSGYSELEGGAVDESVQIRRWTEQPKLDKTRLEISVLNEKENAQKQSKTSPV